MAPSADSGIDGIGCNASGLASAPQKDWAMGQFQQCWHGSQLIGVPRTSYQRRSGGGRHSFRFRKLKKKYPLISTAPIILLCFMLPSNSVTLYLLQVLTPSIKPGKEIVLTRNARPDAILIGLCERRKLRFRLSSFTICEPEVFLI